MDGSVLMLIQMLLLFHLKEEKKFKQNKTKKNKEKEKRKGN